MTGTPEGDSPPDPLSEVFHELLAELGSLEGRLLAHPGGTGDDAWRCEVYRWIFAIAQVGMDCFVHGDARRPRFVDIVGPGRKWGGDNADAFYQYAPVEPGRRYRVSGRRGDAVYLSLTVYGGPDDGRYSERIVGSVNDRDLTFDEDGRFEFWIGPHQQEGPGVLLAPDAVAAITRDYLAHPGGQRRTEWRIESLDPAPPYREDPADLARRMRAALTWVRDQAAIVPVSLPVPNTVDPPYPVPAATFGWAAGDAAYAMGNFDLEAGQALVLRGRSPACAFWNVCLWNPLLHTYDYAADRVTLNGFEATCGADGSWELVISPAAVAHPNHLSTQGHGRGLVWFRWFLPEVTPEPITARVVDAAQVGGPR